MTETRAWKLCVRRSSLIAAFSVATLALTAATVAAQQTAQGMKEEKPGLLAQAKITPDSARAVALARVANGTIREQEIEVEHGRLVYSFDIAQPNRPGVEEVLVDATTGRVVSVSHESAGKEAAEAESHARSGKVRPRKP